MKKKKHLSEVIAKVETEEELKHQFANFFDLPFSTKKNIDLYTPQILFEFKFDAPIKNSVHVRAKTIAQALYYIHRLKFGSDERTISQYFCVATKFAAVLLNTEIFAAFYENQSYDWDRKPCLPCPNLVADLEAAELVINAPVYDFAQIESEIKFVTLLDNIRKKQDTSSKLKKKINENNFYQIYKLWQSLFGEAVENGRKDSEYFITDIEAGKSELLTRSVLFRMTGGERVEKPINPADYKNFWNDYEKISSAHEIIAIRQKMDRMTEISLRRFTGEFFTPIDFAKKAFDYLTRTVGDWWKSDNFRLWDMAAGTGNLEFNFPGDALKFCYISTLLDDDADYCKKIFPTATVFQYDFLNDDESKLPKNLREDLHNPNLKWIIFINPPYATASNKDLTQKNVKSGVSMTAIRKLMTAENLGEVSRELFSQFLYRISRDFSNRQAWLGLFSTLKYINANNDQKMRDRIFSYEYKSGFVFNSQNFDGCRGKFPVGFLIWNLAKKVSLEEQRISLDIYSSDVEKIGIKILSHERREEFLNKWANRPPCTKKFPPMSGALNVAAKNKDRRDRIAENFLASLMCKCNDFSNQNFTALLSAPYVSAGAMSVTPENFEQCMIVHMVRRLPKATWLNDRDQFMQPTQELSREFIGDAVIWSLFAASNQTVSLRDVEYEGEVYQIRNNFYPFALSEIKNWSCSSPDIRLQIFRASEDRFAALWIKKHRADLSAEALAVLAAGRELYKKFYAALEQLNVRKWQIANWDAGWYQIRMSLGASVDLSALSAKLLPQIYELGFLRDEVIYF